MFATVVAASMLNKNRIARLEAQAAKDSGTEDSVKKILTWQSVARATKIRAYQSALANNFATGFISFGLRASVLPLFVVVALGASPAMVGIGFLVSSLTQVALLLPGGRMADNIGRKPAMLLGSGLNAIGMLVLLGWETTPGFFASMVLLGAGGAFLGAAPAAVVGDVIGGRKGGPVLALSQMMMDIGTIVGPLLAGLIADQAGFPAAFGLTAVLAVFVFAFTASMKETRGLPAPKLA
jgi:MFS family permease